MINTCGRKFTNNGYETQKLNITRRTDESYRIHKTENFWVVSFLNGLGIVSVKDDLERSETKNAQQFLQRDM